MRWECGEHTIELTGPPKIMGVLNVTPDSFSDGGRFVEPEAAVQRAYRMIDDGADIIDFGGESTRPGANPVAAHEQITRILSVIVALRKTHSSVPISGCASVKVFARTTNLRFNLSFIILSSSPAPLGLDTLDGE